jgi:chemotaxis protein CheD
MMEKTLKINQLDVTNRPVIYTCFGLGSCIGLFVSDRVKGISGGAHIPLASASVSGEFLDATKMINELLKDFSDLGSGLNSLRAKVIGGAQVYSSSTSIGEQNIRTVIQRLTDSKIFIAATDVGGRVSRTARFNSITGEVHISTSEQKVYCI